MTSATDAERCRWEGCQYRGRYELTQLDGSIWCYCKRHYLQAEEALEAEKTSQKRRKK